MQKYNIYTIQTLLAVIKKGIPLKYLFFWGHQPKRNGDIGKECFSQWYALPIQATLFQIDGVAYQTAEHYMMAEKARLFEDYATCEQIIAAPHPNAAKKLGRAVKGFDEQMWLSHRFEIVVRGNIAKFEQNEALKQFLLNTNKRILVEASPVDKIWGIGLAADDIRATNPEEWQGLNLLGFALMKVRSEFSY